MNTKQNKTGAAQTLAILQQLGVTDIFGYPGGAIMPMYDALYFSPINHYLCRHEQGAAFAAVGYARASGRPGVCMATSGPGATNLITGLADAMADSVAVVAITGQVPTRAMGTDGFQEVDIVGLSLACTKHCFQIKQLKDLPEVLQLAFEIAISGRPGPVLIDIPKDIQVAEVETLSPPLSQTKRILSLVSAASPKQQTESDGPGNEFKQAIELLSHARRPLYYIGGGVGMADAVNELRDMMQTFPLPSVASLKGLGVVALNQPHYLGMLGMHGSRAGNTAIQECDLMLVLGARFDDRATGKLDEFAPHAKVIQLDIDHAEINKRRHADVAIAGDIKETLPKLFAALLACKQPFDQNALKQWQDRCELSVDKNPLKSPLKSHGIFAPALLQELSDSLQETGNNRSYITTDVGQHQMWAAQHMRFSLPNRFISSSGLGTMGFGLPAAIGAQLSDPEAQIICISGDGSFMMNVQELGTIKRYQLPVKILLIDNSKLGLVRQWQQLFFDERYSETDLSDNPDFVMLAKSFDITAETITNEQQISDGLSRMLEHQGPYLLHVKIDAFENVWPLVPPDTANHKMMEDLSQ